FADMEIFVEIQENVRGTDVFVIQSTSYPANDNLMELLIIIDALRRASGRRVTAVIPYFGYARQDRKPAPRTPISAKLVSNLITRAGADRGMTLDLHAGQIQGFFDIPTDNLYAAPMMVRDIKERFDIGKVMVVSPDVGGVGRARGLAKRINAPLAIVDKRRERAGESEVMNVIGEVEGHTCILVDDIIDSGGTVVNAADALLEQGATDVYAYITHGVLSGGAVARITASRLKELVITDSIQPTQAVKVARNIRTLSVATLIGEAIGRTPADRPRSSEAPGRGGDTPRRRGYSPQRIRGTPCDCALATGISGVIFDSPSDSPRSSQRAPPGPREQRYGRVRIPRPSGRVETSMSLIDAIEPVLTNPLEVVERVPSTNRSSFERAGEDEITILVTGKWTDYQVSYTWMFDIEALHLACAFELKVPERCRAEVQQLISLINEQMWVGHFDLWVQDGLVMYRHALV